VSTVLLNEYMDIWIWLTLATDLGSWLGSIGICFDVVIECLTISDWANPNRD